MANTIRGLVYDNYSSIREFARMVGWDKTKACNIVSGKREPRLSDLNSMAPAVGKTVEELAHIFLRDKSQKRDSASSDKDQ